MAYPPANYNPFSIRQDAPKSCGRSQNNAGGWKGKGIQSLRHTVGADCNVVDVLDALRRKGNVSNYERGGAETEGDAQDVT